MYSGGPVLCIHFGEALTQDIKIHDIWAFLTHTHCLKLFIAFPAASVMNKLPHRIHRKGARKITIRYTFGSGTCSRFEDQQFLRLGTKDSAGVCHEVFHCVLILIIHFTAEVSFFSFFLVVKFFQSQFNMQKNGQKVFHRLVPPEKYKHCSIFKTLFVRARPARQQQHWLSQWCDYRAGRSLWLTKLLMKILLFLMRTIRS